MCVHTYMYLVEKQFWRHLIYQFVHLQHKPRWCTLCCTGGWAKWRWLLLYCPLCSSSEGLLQVGSEL